jgi:hypothetical protein
LFDDQGETGHGDLAKCHCQECEVPKASKLRQTISQGLYIAPCTETCLDAIQYGLSAIRNRTVSTKETESLFIVVRSRVTITFDKVAREDYDIAPECRSGILTDRWKDVKSGLSGVTQASDSLPAK